MPATCYWRRTFKSGLGFSCPSGIDSGDVPKIWQAGPATAAPANELLPHAARQDHSLPEKRPRLSFSIQHLPGPLPGPLAAPVLRLGTSRVEPLPDPLGLMPAQGESRLK